MRRMVFIGLSLATLLNAKTLEVCPDGCEYSSPQEAINHAAERGDIVFIKEGIYSTGLDLGSNGSKCITIKGEGRDKTILVPEGKRGINILAPMLGHNDHCDIKIEDLQLRGGQADYGEGII